jgi:hypothetical protein
VCSFYGPKTAANDIGLGPVVLDDYYHLDYFSILEICHGHRLERHCSFSVSNLVNGKGQYNCSLITDGTPCTTNAGYSKFQFESGKTHRLRLINAGAEGIQKFSIDDHVLAVITIDFVPIVPHTTTIVTMVGALVSILVVFLTGYPNRELVSEPTFSLQPTSAAPLLSGCARRLLHALLRLSLMDWR